MMDSNPDRPKAQSGQTHDAVRRVRRKRRWRMFFRIVALIFILFVIALIYAQTSMAVRQIWLPLASEQVGTKITANRGTISYRGKLYLNQFSIMGTDGQPALTADDIWFDIAPLSILKGKPHIVRAEAANPSVRVRLTREGASNWDFREPEPKRAKEKKTISAPTVEIDTLFIKNLVLDVQQADELKVNMTAPEIRAKDISPGHDGDFDVAIEGTVERPLEKMSQRGTISAGGFIKQTVDGKQVEWETNLKSSVTGTAPGFEGEQKVDVQATSKGNYNLAGILNQQFVLRASSPAGPAGSIDGDVTWDMTKNVRQMKFVVGGIGREALNPILATIAPLQIQRGKIVGTTTVEGKGDLVEFKADFGADGLSFELADQNKPTAALNLRLRQTGDVNIKTGELTWREADFTLSEETRRLIQATLDKPLSIYLSGQPAAKSASEEQAAFKVTIDGLTARTLQPWLMLARIEPSTQPSAGTLSGEFTVGVSRQGASLRAQGRLAAEGLKQPSLGPNAINLRNQFDVTMTDFNNLDLKQLTLDMTGERGPLASATVSGKMRARQQSGEFDIDLTAPETLGLASNFNLLARPAEGVRDGKLALRQQVKLDMAEGKNSTSGKLSITGMAVSKEGQSRAIDVTGDNRLTYDARKGRVEIEDLRLNLAHPGVAQPGLIEVSGHWDKPPKATRGAGEMHVTASKLNLTPWLLVSGAIAGRNAPPIPFEASENIVIGSDGRMRVQGEMRIGVEPGATPNTTLQVNHDLVQAGAAIQQAVLEMTSRAGGGVSDRVRIDASGEIGKAPRLALNVNADKLNLNPYLAWYDRLTTPSLRATTSAAGPAKEKETKKPAEAIVSANLQVGELQWRDSRLMKAQGTYRYENGAMTLDVAQGVLNDGTLKGQANIDLTRAEARYAWNASLAKANASRTLAMFDPSLAQRVSGEITLDTKCTGQGSGETFKRTFQGTNTFVVLNGEFKGVTILDILAKQTLVDSFANMKFFDFSGGVDIKDKVCKLNKVKVTGPEHRIDFEGQFDLDGNYEIACLPAVATGVAQKISNNKWLPSLVKAVPGFMQFPFKILIKGNSKTHTVLPAARMPINIGNVAGAVGGAVGAVGGAVGNVVEKVPGSGVVTRPIEQLKKLNPLGKEGVTTKTESGGIINRIPGSEAIRNPVTTLRRLNPLSKDKATTR